MTQNITYFEIFLTSMSDFVNHPQHTKRKLLYSVVYNLFLQFLTVTVSRTICAPQQQNILFWILLKAYLVAYLSYYHEKATKALKRARFGVAGHLSTTPRWGNPAGCLSPQHILFILFSSIFILLSRESDQSAIRARLGVSSHLSTTLKWGIPLSAFPNGTTSKLAGLFSTLSL